LDRMRTPKPLTSVSQRKTWPVLGLCARFTLASVSFFPMAISDSATTAFCARIPYGAVWGTMAGYAEKSRKLGHVLRFYMGRCGGGKGGAPPPMGGGNTPPSPGLWLKAGRETARRPRIFPWVEKPKNLNKRVVFRLCPT